jgi:hypothetical protein
VSNDTARNDGRSAVTTYEYLGYVNLVDERGEHVIIQDFHKHAERILAGQTIFVDGWRR